MIVGDNNFIKNKILASAVILDAVPSLRSLSDTIRSLAAKCNTCAGDRAAVQKLDKTWNELRQLLVSLPEDRKTIIRQHASGGQRIRISYKQGSGQNTTYVSGDV